MDLQLSGRVAVITGASKGIGLAVTRTLLDEGVRVVAASRTSTPELEALSGDLLHVPTDLMDPEAPAQIVEKGRDGVRWAGHPGEQRRRPTARRDSAALRVPGRH
ncbi:SDR family NAD(P)-dependent oxidoreductase [Nonomuraea salmonea]|uniref:SDR family NAD(P)-dependent oxidoreductase n=1 Tax=Nonomuraea salmonea TaxID=46181 RepID=UPI002FE7A2A1